MKKNIIIGVLSGIIIVMALFSYSQKVKAEQMAKIAIELREQAEMQRAIAETAKEIAEQAKANAQMLMEDAIRRAEIAKELSSN